MATPHQGLGTNDASTWPEDFEQRASLRAPLSDITLRFDGTEYVGWGDIGCGGIHWMGLAPLCQGDPPEVEFRLPGCRKAFHLTGEIVRQTRDRDGISMHIRFESLPFETELAIAKYVDDLELMKTSH